MRRASLTGFALLGLSLAVAPGCRRQKVEVNDIVPSLTLNRSKAPLGSPIEINYTWTVEPTARKIPQEYRALVHFVDAQKVVLFTDAHVPVPPVTAWEPGKTYSYSRTFFIPVYPFVGDARILMGLYPMSGEGERLALKGEDIGLRAYKVSTIELLPQTENIFLVYKDGWHSPESSPDNPSLERTWTRKDAFVSFKNPKKDVIVYLEAETNSKAFPKLPTLTVVVGEKSGVVIPIADSFPFLKKIRVKASELGTADWVNMRLAMDQSFVPKQIIPNSIDDRELGLMLYHLAVVEAEQVGTNLGQVMETIPVSLPSPSPRPSPSPSPKASPSPSPSAKGKGSPSPVAKAPVKK